MSARSRFSPSWVSLLKEELQIPPNIMGYRTFRNSLPCKYMSSKKRRTWFIESQVLVRVVVSCFGCFAGQETYKTEMLRPSVFSVPYSLLWRVFVLVQDISYFLNVNILQVVLIYRLHHPAYKVQLYDEFWPTSLFHFKLINIIIRIYITYKETRFERQGVMLSVSLW